MTEHEKMLRGLIYDPTDPELSKLSKYAKHKAFVLNQTNPSDEETYLQRLKELLPGLGENSYVAPGVQVDYGVFFKTGKNFFANYGFVILDVCPITCGDNVMCGVGVHLVTPVHPLLASERNPRLQKDGTVHDLEYGKPIVIGNGVWLASDVTVCGGVTIGDNTVVAAGAVVTKDLPSGVLAGGVPCRVIRPLTEKDRLGVYDD